MKDKISKTISIIISSAMLMTSFIPQNSMKAHAVWCAKDGFDKSRYTLTGNMAEDVATIAKSQKGRFCDDFGYSGVDWGAWCDEYVADCLENAGCDSSIVAHGGTVADFANKMRQRGAVQVSSPQTGDLVFFTYSHVEIVTKVENGVVYSAGGNNNDPNTNTYHDGGCCAGEHRTYNASYYLRPAYNNTPITPNSIVFHSGSVSDITTNDAVISTWTTNNNGEIFSTGFWIGTDQDNMQLFTTYSHVGWTEFHGEYRLSDYYGSLSPGTTYYYRYYLISADGMKYYQSDVESFKTSGAANITFDTFETVSNSSDTAELSGWTRNSNGYTIKSYGILIGDSITDMEKVEIGRDVAWTDFHTKINVIDHYKQLSPETQYYYRWYVDVDTTYYSDILTFNTIEDIYPPLIQSFSTEDLNDEGFTLVSKITDNVGVNKATFTVWKDGSPDKITVDANPSHDDYYCYRFSVSDFNNESGVYHAIVDAFDNRNANAKELDIIVPEKSIMGDCNGDGEFKVSDVVLLQKWLLAVPDTHFSNWKAADFCEDDKLDVFDLCLMKRALIQSLGGDLQ